MHPVEVMTDISLLELESHERDIIRAYLELVAAQMQKERNPSSKQKRSVSDVFRLPDVTEYYTTHDFPAKWEEIEKYITQHDHEGLYIPLDLIVKKTHTYDKWENYTFKRIELEMTRAAHRLIVRGFGTFFVGTPKFSGSAICISLERIRIAADNLNKKVPPLPPVPEPEVGLLHPTLDGDVPSWEECPENIDLTYMDEAMTADIDQERHDAERSFLTLSDLSKEERKIIEVAFRNHNRVTLPVVISDVQTLEGYRHYQPKTLYMRLYRAARSLNTMGLATAKKGSDGLFWIEIDKEKVLAVIKRDVEPSAFGVAGTVLDNGKLQNSNSVIEPPKPKKSRQDIFAMPKNAHGPRKAAINFLMGVKMLDYEENKRDRELKRHSQGPYHDARHLMNLFQLYSDDSIQKIIVLMNKITGETVGSDYSTRFNDYKKGLERLRRYEYAHDQTLYNPEYDFKDAVFLTLTTDPKRFPNLFHANRHMSIAWNHFMQCLTVKIGGRSKRPKYICACEYTKTGLLHLHILLFGRNHLFSEDKDIEQMEISRMWEKCGQGKIVKAYGLTNTDVGDGKREWRWTGKKQPSDAKGLSGGDYLKKYLKKCMMAITDQFESASATLAPYWALNKRFFTCSQCFLPPKDEEVVSVGASSAQFMLYCIEYGIDLNTAQACGHIDRIGYRRWDPDNVEESPPPDPKHPTEEVVT